MDPVVMLGLVVSIGATSLAFVLSCAAVAILLHGHAARVERAQEVS